MPKHYHLISGMPGYLPNANDYYATKREAQAGARWWVKTFREDGERWMGSATKGEYYRVKGSPYYILIVADCDHDCDPDPCW